MRIVSFDWDIYYKTCQREQTLSHFSGFKQAMSETNLPGTGKFMRHVKLRPGSDFNATALRRLIKSAYADMKLRQASLP